VCEEEEKEREAIMAWTVGTVRYRGRAVRAESQISENENGTIYAEVVLECSAGPQAGQRVRYRGYISGSGGVKSPKNEEATAAELRAMGAKLARGWDDLDGIGTKEVEFTVMADVNDGKTYYRAAFVRPPVGLNRERKAHGDALDALGPPPPPAVNGASLPTPPTAADDGDEAAGGGESLPF
jgi:hypothetical protein